MRRHISGWDEVVRSLARAILDSRHTGRWPMRARVSRILHMPMNAAAWHWAPDWGLRIGDTRHWLWRLNDRAGEGYTRLWSRGRLK